MVQSVSRPGRPVSGVSGESRTERKERTRRAILDATLSLCEDSSLVALSLRQVAKEVGIVPTAFYRHFDSIEDLGLALVEESFVSLRAMLRELPLWALLPAQLWHARQRLRPSPPPPE